MVSSLLTHIFTLKEECIPVGCVPAARRLYAGVCFRGGVCSGGVCSGGVCSGGSASGESAPGGVSAPVGVLSRGGSAPWGSCCLGVSAPRGLLQGGVWSQGGVCWGGWYPACTEADPPVNRMTNRYKNITLATTSLRLVINIAVCKNNTALELFCANVQCYIAEFNMAYILK